LREARDATQCADCEVELRPAWYFRLTYADTMLTVDGDIGGPERDWLRHELAELGSEPGRDWEHGSIVDTLGASPSLVILTMRRDADHRPLAAYGFALPASSLADGVVRPVLGGPTLLPLPPRSAPANDSVLSISLVSPGGHRSVAFNPPRDESPYTANLHAGMYFGGWRFQLSLDRRTAPGFLIGAMPQSRGWLLALLVMLSFGLIATTFVMALRALRLAQAREGFVANVSHELRTPLAEILLFSETISLRRMTSLHDAQQAASVITGETRRLIELVERVLAFGRNGRSRHPPRALPRERLIPIVEETIAAFAPIATQAEARLRTVPLEDLTAPVDRTGLRQVLMNLLDNAVKFGPRGGVVTVSLTQEDGRAVLRVDDEGPGIPPRDRDRIWAPFHRLDRDVEARVAGSGLGLAVVRDAVKQHGGRVTAEDAPSGGARFVVTLPGSRVARPEPIGCAS
jgi:signal transduction histidine kinase